MSISIENNRKDNFFGKARCSKEGKCPALRNVDLSGCVCDLLFWAKSHSDWQIAKFVGSATYAQLLDSAPGLFEPFPDYRSDGNTASSLSQFGTTEQNTSASTLDETRVVQGAICRSGFLPKEILVPGPPNLVSTILVEGMTPADLKRALIKASLGVCPIDPRILPLIASSQGYQSPECSLWDIFILFVVTSAIVALTISLIVRTYKNNFKKASFFKRLTIPKNK